MILYVTKKTKERLHIPFCDELSDRLKNIAKILLLKEDNPIFKWGIKIFYFDNLVTINANKKTKYVFPTGII